MLPRQCQHCNRHKIFDTQDDRPSAQNNLSVPAGELPYEYGLDSHSLRDHRGLAGALRNFDTVANIAARLDSAFVGQQFG